MTPFWAGRLESLRMGDAADSLLANVEFYLLLIAVCSSWRQPTTLEGCAEVVVLAGLWHRTPCCASP